MSETSGESIQPADHERAGTIFFFADTYRFYLEGLKALRNELAKFASLKEEFALGYSAYDEVLERMNGIIDWAVKRIPADASSRSTVVEHGVSYGSLRLLKAGGVYQLNALQRRRNQLVRDHPDIPRVLLGAIDEKIEQYRDRLEQGTMQELKPAENLPGLDQVRTVEPAAVTSPPVAISGTGALAASPQQLFPVRGLFLAPCPLILSQSLMMSFAEDVCLSLRRSIHRS